MRKYAQTIEQFKKAIGHQRKVTEPETIHCYCGASAHATFHELQRAGWRWLASWWGWACPDCRPRDEVRA